MPMSTDVNLPKDHRPRFPDRCVVCGCDSPGSTVRLFTTATGWWSIFVSWFSKPFIIRAPACRWCGWRLHLLRAGGLLFMFAFLLACMSLIWPLLSPQVARPLRKWVFIGVAFVCLIPLWLWKVFFPAPFDLIAFTESVDYQFRDEELAREFAALNRDAAWVKVG